MRIAALAILMAAHGPAAAALVETAPPTAQQRADQLVEANAALRAGDLDAARAGFEAVRRTAPGEAAPYLGLSDIYAKQGNLVAAEAILRTGLTASRTTGVLNRALGLLYALQNKPDLAVASFDAAIASGENVVQTRIEAANLLNFRLNLAARALPYYTAALAQDPGNALAHYGKGLALARLQKPGDPSGPAMAELETAQRLNPADPMAPMAIAQERARTGDLPGATAALDEALRRRPGLVPALVVRGDLLQLQGRGPDAVASYRAALQEDPTATPAWVGLALAQQTGGDATAAEASYRQALAHDPASVVALNNLGVLLTEQPAQWDEALASVRKAVALAPGEAAVWDTLGWLEYRRGDLGGAATDLQRSVTLAPTAATLTRLGMVKAALGKKTEAGEAFRRALQLQPGHAPALEGLKSLG